MDERTAYIALNAMQGVGPVSVRALAARLGSAEAILSAPRERLAAGEGAPRDVVEKILEQREAVDPEAEVAKAEARGAHVLTFADAAYPKALRDIHSPPLALYVWGTLEPQDARAVAVVGTRHATRYGLDCAEKLSYQLVQAGFTVSSGLARGVDTAAHRGALKARGRTLAVVGSGLDRLYPPENRGLAEEIAGCGAVLSEYPMGREADKTTFPVRNRIVSALSMGVLVVEAGAQSGALNTARHAMEQGKTVFAVPGRIDSHASRGTHRLLRDGARLVEDVEDILEEFSLLLPRRGAEPTAADLAQQMPPLSPDEAAVTSLLAEGEMDVDELIRRTGLAARVVSSVLIALEMKRVVRMLPGRVVELRARRGGGG